MKIDRHDLGRVQQIFPVRISRYLQNLMRNSDAIARQFLPDVEELKPKAESPFEDVDGITDIPGFERRYPDRAILKVNAVCLAHCRYCFRRDIVGRQGTIVNDLVLESALHAIREDKRLRNILITGGSPTLIGIRRLDTMVDHLLRIPHITQVYIALGRPIFNPKHFASEETMQMLSKYAQLTSGSSSIRKSLGCTIHINHPDELTEEVLEAIAKLNSTSIKLWNQAVLLKGINDSPLIMYKLCSKLADNRVIPYYMFHAAAVEGTYHFRTSVQKGVDIMRYLEQYSGHERPLYAVDTPVGKVNLNGSSPLQYECINGARHIYFKTPYLIREYLDYMKIHELPSTCRAAEDGYIETWYLDSND